MLGTELFEQLPDKKVNLIATMAANEAVDDSSPFSVFEVDSEPKTVTEARTRQFLCFSDSRSEAAFFANYMEKSYDGVSPAAAEYGKSQNRCRRKGKHICR